MYANNFFEQNIIKNTSNIVITISFYAFFEFRIIIYLFSSSLTFSKKIRFYSIKKRTKIDFFIDKNIDVNSFQFSRRIFASEKKYRSTNKSFISESALKSSTKKIKIKKQSRIVLNKKLITANIVRSNKIFATDIVETLNVKNCNCTMISKKNFEL